MNEVEIFRAEFAKGSSLVAGVVERKDIGHHFDVIHLVVTGIDGAVAVEFWAAPEEAITISWALQKCLYYFFNTFPPYCEWRKEGSCTPEGWDPEDPPEMYVEELL